MAAVLTACAHPRIQPPTTTGAGLPPPGTVEGVVFWNERPFPGAHVYATSEYNFQSTRYGDAFADRNGHFAIRNVPPGQKYLYVFGTGREFWVAAVTPFTMPAGAGTIAPPSYLCKGFDPLFPARAATVTSSRPTLAWTPYPDAVDYAVRVIRTGDRFFTFSRGDRDPHITATSVDLDTDLPDGEYSWRVDAFNRAGHIIGCSYYPRPFVVQGTGPSAAPHSLHGDSEDPVGDAQADARLARAPDLVHTTVDVADGHARFLIRLAPGTFDRTTTLVIVNLDVDANASTGQAIAGLGVDYVISMGDGQGDTALIARYGGSPATFIPVDRVPVTFTADEMEVTIPAATVGNPAIRMNLRVMSFVHLPNSQTTGTIDVLPDVTRAPLRVE